MTNALKVMFRSLFWGLGLVFVFSPLAHAISIDWSGMYRAEYLDVPNTLPNTTIPAPGNVNIPAHVPTGGPSSGGKEYFLNYLSLEPKIIISDGINARAKIDVLPNQWYPNSQLGGAFGLGSQGYDYPGSFSSASTTSGDQAQLIPRVSEAYITISQEYGEFFFGRVPVQFGLGMTYSAGNGPFDHWADTRDMVGYRVLMGNLSITPMYGREDQRSPGVGQNVQDMAVNLDYTNPETDSTIAIWFQIRNSSQASNDAPAGYLGAQTTYAAPADSMVTGGWNTQDLNVYLARGFDSVKFRIEAGFRSGTTGITDYSENNYASPVKINGYGIAAEMDLPSRDAATYWQIRAGVASGDNPNTSNFEGYYFNRNYDVAFLLMNHPLGSYDLFRTYAQRGAYPGAPSLVRYNGQAMDDEVISNVYYLSPKYKLGISDHWDWSASLTAAELQTQPLAGTTVAADVGEEFDTAIVYKPTKKIQWSTELGLLNAGGAFKGGSNNYSAGFIYGVQTRAVFSF